jgi:hypothetical protein
MSGITAHNRTVEQESRYEEGERGYDQPRQKQSPRPSPSLTGSLRLVFLCVEGLNLLIRWGVHILLPQVRRA